MRDASFILPPANAKLSGRPRIHSLVDDNRALSAPGMPAIRRLVGVAAAAQWRWLSTADMLLAPVWWRRTIQDTSFKSIELVAVCMKVALSASRRMSGTNRRWRAADGNRSRETFNRLMLMAN